MIPALLKRCIKKHSKFGAIPKWGAHFDWPSMRGDETSTTTIPPWRHQSLWRIIGTRTVEGLSEQPRCEVKQLYEALLKKHVIECTMLMKEFEEMKAAGNGKNEEFEAKGKGWKQTMEEIFSHERIDSKNQWTKKLHNLKKVGRRSMDTERNKAFLSLRHEVSRGRLKNCRRLRSNPSLTPKETKRKKGRERSRRRKPGGMEVKD